MIFAGGLSAVNSSGGRCSVRNQKGDKPWEIHLVPTPESDLIRGKLHICDKKEIQHYGIVVELEGIITFSDRSKNSIKLFAPEVDSPTIMRSTVYCQLAGKPEGLEKGDPPPECLKKLRPKSHMFEFKLALPTRKPLPAALTTQLVDVAYNIIVYKRTPAGYEVMEEKPLIFYGYHGLLPEQINRPQLPITQEFPAGISLTLQTPKSSYLRYQFIPFSVSISIRPEKPLSLMGSISAFLVKTVTVSENSQTSIVDTFTSRKIPNQREFCIRGAFKGKRESPTYDSPDVPGLKIKYSIRCDVFNRDSALIARSELDIEIGTKKIAPVVAENASPFRSRRGSLASSMLSLFPPGYSNLSSRSSRSGSITSLETLPPHYDDLNYGERVSEEEKTAET